MTMPTAQTDVPAPPVDGSRPIRILVMIGSTRQQRFGPIPAAWVTTQARARNDIDLDVADLAELKLPVVLAGNDPHAPLPDEVARLAHGSRRRTQ